VYRRREFAGTVRRGLFVQPGSGEQYALPHAVEHLREVRQRPGTAWLVLSAVDPALGFGSAFPEPRLIRHPAHLVVLRAGRPLLGLEGTRLWAAPDLATETRAEALAALIAERRGRRLTVETWHDTPILACPWLALLGDLGFHGDGDRLTFDGYPGPRPRPRGSA
jgi:ATP-dependent Lhr-like helicase